MDKEVNGRELIANIFTRLIGLKPTRVELGHGSFITFDFGQEKERQRKSRTGEIKIFRYGEWHLWIYMCAWRIDKDCKPFVGSNDSRKLIQERLSKMQGKGLKSVAILNDAFDAHFVFENGLELYLFSYQVADHEQWMLYHLSKIAFSASII